MRKSIFSTEEADELKRRLDDLENLLLEQIDKEKKDKKGLEKEIKKLHQDIEKLSKFNI